MEIWLRDFSGDQLLGLNGLVNRADFASLLALSVRDGLKLRILWRDDQDRKIRQSGLESAVAANDD
jgi:hypothetical protein